MSEGGTVQGHDGEDRVSTQVIGLRFRESEDSRRTTYDGLIDDDGQSTQLEYSTGRSIGRRSRVEIGERRMIGGEGEVRGDEDGIDGLRDDEIEGDEGVTDCGWIGVEDR